MNALQQFLASKDPRSLAPQLKSVWSPALHEEAIDALASAGEHHLWAYLEMLYTRGGYSRLYISRGDVPASAIADQALPLLRDRTITGKDATARKLAHLQLAWLVAAGETETAAAHLEVMDHELANVLPVELRARANRGSPQAEQALLARIASGEAISADAFLHFARPKTRQASLNVLLGQAGRSTLFLHLHEGPLQWFDGTTFYSTPIEYPRGVEGYRLITGETPLDQRILFWSGQHSWSLLQRYGNVVLLQEMVFSGGYGHGSIQLHAVVDCREEKWTTRLVEAFVRSRPKSQRRVDGHLDPKKGVFVRVYEDREHQRRPSGARKVFSRGVQRDAFVTAGMNPDRWERRMRDEPELKLHLEKPFDDEVASVAAFEASELELLSSGWSLKGITACPIRDVETPYPLRVGDEDTRASIEKLGAMINGDDEALHKQAETLILGLEDPAIDRWLLEKLTLERGASFDPRIGLLVRRAPRGFESVEVHRISGFSKLDTAALAALIDRADDDDLVGPFRRLRALSIGTNRLEGYWDLPLRLDSITAFSALELLILECGTESNSRAPTPLRGLQDVARLDALQSLVISNATDVDLAPLRDARSLRHLELHETQAKHLGALREHPIETLILDGCRFDDHIDLPLTLRRLVIRGGEVDATLPWSKLQDLSSLQLSTQAGSLAGIDACESLRVLDLRGCPWADDLCGPARLAEAGSLRALAAAQTPLHPNAIPASLLDVITYAEFPNLPEPT